MSTAPKLCMYCDQHGNSSAGGKCGFCIDGTPLDTQKDWDSSWGGIHNMSDEFINTRKEEQ